MKILIKQFLGQRHSWSVCGWGLATAFLEQEHEVHLFATDGIKHLPPHLKPHLIGYTEENNPGTVFGRQSDLEYDLALSYTAMINFPFYLKPGKNKLGIWCYEWANKNSLPTGFAKHYKSCDYLCAPSNFAKQVFMESNIPEKTIKVIPHGINVQQYQGTSTIQLPTQKRFKLLANLAQLHLRKNIPGLLEAYGKAFTNKDDVCLIIKAKDHPPKSPFDISLKECLKQFYQNYPQHAEIKIFDEFVEDISALYRSVDTIYSMTFCEGFYFPGLEGIASGKLSIAPNYGGQLDFLNASNSLLIEGREEKADPKSMYWERKNNAIWFRPSIDDAVNKLQYAYQNYEKLNEQIDKQRPDVYAKYDWSNISKQFLDLCK